MRNDKTYIQPCIKVRVIDTEDYLLAATTQVTSRSLSITSEEITSDEIGAKADNTSGGWDDWDEDGD